MRIKTCIPFIFLALLGCEGEIIDRSKEKGVEFLAEIEGEKSQANNTVWEAGDAIGVFMKSSEQSHNNAALAENTKYVTDGSSSFSVAPEMSPITLASDGSSVDFISYSPYRNELRGDEYMIDLTNQSNQRAIDLLYSNNANNQSADNSPVKLLFTHQLSKIALNISSPPGVKLTGLQVALYETGTKAKFDLSTGSISDPTAYGDILLNVEEGAGWAEGILLPTNNVSNMELWFFLPSFPQPFKYALKESHTITSFEKSTCYTYNVILQGDQTVVLTKGSIRGWEEGPSEEAIATPGEKAPPEGIGSFDYPFSVSEALQEKNLGKKEVWVEGYIVGTVNGTMNKFQPGAIGEITSNIVIADREDETDISKMLPVNLSEATKAIREDLNLPHNPSNFNRKIKIIGNIETYFRVPGLRKPKWCEFTDLP